MLLVDRSAVAPAAGFSLSAAGSATAPNALRFRPALAAKAANDKVISAAAALTFGDMAPAAAAGVGIGATAPAAMPATNPAQPAPGHDFAALVDRLLAARDAASAPGGSVDVSVRHADFGEVAVRFHHDPAGLTVSVASADPDFARAVEAAVPPPAAATAGNSTTGQSPSGQSFAGGQAGLQSGHAGAQSQGNGQGRASFTGPRGDRPAANPADADTPRETATYRGRYA